MPCKYSDVLRRMLDEQIKLGACVHCGAHPLTGLCGPACGTQHSNECPKRIDPQDVETICSFMEPKPDFVTAAAKDTSVTWWQVTFARKVLPRILDFVDLFEVEVKLIETGRAFTYNNLLTLLRGDKEIFWGWHATVAQKIRAAARAIKEIHA